MDLRDQTNPSENAYFPKDLALRWQNHFKEYLSQRKPREGRLGGIKDRYEQHYAEYLERLTQLDRIDLRVMLESAEAPELNLDSRVYPSRPWDRLFSDFMLKEGFDGLIYNEGEEGKYVKGGVSYIFYNLEKIGTYETWQELKVTTKDPVSKADLVLPSID